MQFAYASITPESGFQAQLYDYDPNRVDSYWIKQVSLTPTPHLQALGWKLRKIFFLAVLVSGTVDEV